MTLTGITNNLWIATSGKHFGMLIYGKIRGVVGLGNGDKREQISETRRGRE